MQFALRFISGKYQGGEFPIEDGKEIVVGRSSDLDMVLVEGERMHSESEGMLIDPDQAVEIVGINGNRLVVRRLSVMAICQSECCKPALVR